MSGKRFRSQGAEFLSEPLGKLMALQSLDLGSKIFMFVLFGRGSHCVIAWFWALFLTRMSGNWFGPEGARALSEPLGKLTALQQLHLEGTILVLS
jgi:hypothetical protein